MHQSTDYDAKGYWKQFYRTAHRNLPHRLLLACGLKLHIEPLVSLLDNQKRRQLHKKLQLHEYPESAVAEYLAHYPQAHLWHGTGRYQHGQFETVDVLKSIAELGALAPVLDVYPVLHGGEPTTSISTTPYRIIARSYADVHGRGIAEQNRYGSCRFWAAYFYSKYNLDYYSLDYLGRSVLHRATVKRNREAWENATSKDGEILWGKKVHSQAEYVWDVFTSGSDISKNYPIIFAIKAGLRTAELPDVLTKYETRITEKITWSHIVHLEVPERHLADTERFLKSYGVNVPIFPIELGELVASQQRFSRLISYQSDEVQALK